MRFQSQHARSLRDPRSRLAAWQPTPFNAPLLSQAGARFNSKHLVYTVEESRLDPEVAARFVRLSRDPEAEVRWGHLARVALRGPTLSVGRPFACFRS